jgi:hypothetical protein
MQYVSNLLLQQSKFNKLPGHPLLLDGFMTTIKVPAICFVQYSKEDNLL